MRPLRIYVTEGPGDAIGSFKYWRDGLDNPNVTHVPFSSQTYEACSEHHAQVMVVSECRNIDSLRDGSFAIYHRGNPAHGKSGLAYHFTELRLGLRTIVEIVRFRADLVIVGLRPYLFLMLLLRLFGIKVVLVLHNVLWCQFGQPPTRAQRILHRMNGVFIARNCHAISCVSADIKRQVQSLAGPVQLPFVDFLPWFRAATFSGIDAPVPDRRPFRVLFAGRVERNKGVFELLAIAASIHQGGRRDFVFELCGEGEATPELSAAVAASEVSSTFELKGYCSRAQMREAFSRAHAVIVPTRSDFVEGFNMVVVEALLAERPVVTSRVCPAVEYVRGAVVEIEPDHWQGYETALLRLADDQQFYRSIQGQCRKFGERFLDEATSWQSALQHALDDVEQPRKPVTREIDPAHTPAPETTSAQ